MSKQNEAVPLKDIELGFTRKRDGKIVNVKLMEIFRKFKSIDFLNNEVVLDGEVLVADSFRNPYYEAQMGVIKNSVNGGNGTYMVNGTTYDSTHSFTVEKGSTVNITLIPAQGSVVQSVTDENGNVYDVREGVATINMDGNHTITINFTILPQ